MADEKTNDILTGMRIVVIKNGPYIVAGNVPLVRKTQVVSEYGEPLAWKKDGEISVSESEYHLCRCGQSGDMPFCDGTHRAICFDGTETAGTDVASQQWLRLPGDRHIQVKKSFGLCMQSGFCGLKDVSIEQLVTECADTTTRTLVISMVNNCPAGALTYQVDPLGPVIEPDYPRQIAVTTEITSAGPILGPLWVTGGIPVERSDGQPFETRNRVTLCNCGHSLLKPLCDGTHRHYLQPEQEQKPD